MKRLQWIRTAIPAPREGLREMLRRPGMQVLLVVVATVQVVVVAQQPRGEVAATELEPMLVTRTIAQAADAGDENPVVAVWRAKALERESARVASMYRNQGFRIPQDLERKIHHAAAEFSIEPAIAFGLIRAESSFRNSATSPVGAVGLTQLMPRTAAWMQPGVTRAQLRDPETNLRIGFQYLRYLLDKYDGNEDLALLAYNRGPGTVDRALRSGRNPDNGYARFVRGERNHGHRLFTR